MAAWDIAYPLPADAGGRPTYSANPAPGDIVGRNLVPTPKFPVNGQPIADRTHQDTIASRGTWKGNAANTAITWTHRAYLYEHGASTHHALKGLYHWTHYPGTSDGLGYFMVSTVLTIDPDHAIPNVVNDFECWISAGALTSSDKHVIVYVRPEQMGGAGIPDAAHGSGIGTYGRYMTTHLPEYGAPENEYVDTHGEITCVPTAGDASYRRRQELVVYAQEVGTGGVAGGGFKAQDPFVEHVRIDIKGSTYSGYFDGDTPDTSTHEFSWTGTPGASTSIVKLKAPVVTPGTPIKPILASRPLTDTATKAPTPLPPAQLPEPLPGHLTRNMQLRLRDEVKIHAKGSPAESAIVVKAYVGTQTIRLTNQTGWIVTENTTAIVGPNTVVAEADNVIWHGIPYVVTAVRKHQRPTDNSVHHLTLDLKGWTGTT